MATLTLVVALLAASAWIIGEQFGSSHTSKRVTSTPAGFAQFKDPAGAFEGSYPAHWNRLQSSVSEVVLLATGPAGASYLVRKTPITGVVTAANLAAARTFTERIVHSGKDVKYLHAPQLVTLGGLPGYLYLYTFVDPKSGQQGAHAHYFLFDGKTMITLVFQALPSTGFLAMAPLFDQIAKTFRALPTASGTGASPGG